MTRPLILQCYVGPDVFRREGWGVSFHFLAFPHLMGPGDAGRYILAVLRVRLTFWWPWSGDGWRCPVLGVIASDADEIAHRQAEASGWVTR